MDHKLAVSDPIFTVEKIAARKPDYAYAVKVTEYKPDGSIASVWEQDWAPETEPRLAAGFLIAQVSGVEAAYVTDDDSDEDTGDDFYCDQCGGTPQGHVAGCPKLSSAGKCAVCDGPLEGDDKAVYCPECD